MSANLLEPEADDLATVAEALAFIDACEDSEGPVGSGNGSTSGSDSGWSPLPGDRNFDQPTVSPSTVPPVDAIHAPESTQKPKRRRRSKNPAGYSTRLLHRKKAEMQQLREQAQQLEAQVEQLRRARAPGVTAIAAHATQVKYQADVTWMEIALLECQRRRQSEYTNRKLRALLASQMKVDEALRGVVMNPSVLKEMEFVYEKAPTPLGPLSTVDCTDVIMADLEKKVSEMYLGSRMLFDLASGALSTNCEMRRRADNQLGNVVEIVSSAPLSSSLEAASSSLWKELTTIRTYPDKSYRYMQTSKPDSMEKNFDQIMRGNAGAVPLNGLQFMRKFEEDDRVVLARAYTMLLPTEGLHLRGNAWTIFSRSETNPAEACEVRFFVQLYMEAQSGFSACPEDIAYLQDIAFETWSLKMRGHAQQLQELLIEAADASPNGVSQFIMKPTC